MKTSETTLATANNAQNGYLHSVVEKLVEHFDESTLSQYDSYIPLNLAHYTQEQQPWIETLMQKINENKNSSGISLEDCLLNTTTSQKYRAIYVLLHPDLVIHQNLI